MKQYDVIWIGTGQATLTVVPRLSAAGKSVAVIEANQFGGTCVNTGCTPTKTLVAAARAIHQAGRGADFGFSTGLLRVDFAKVMAPQQRNRASATQGIESALKAYSLCDVFYGEAHFIDSHTVQVGDTVLTGTDIIINAGCRPAPFMLENRDGVDILTNETLLDLTVQPEHLAIVGGSYIGLEFAQIFRRLGSQVTVLERGSQLMFREDRDIAQIASDVLSDEGVMLHCGAELKKVSRQHGRLPVLVEYQQDGKEKQLHASHCLYAAGRVPNSDRLNLGAAGIECDEHGYIKVNDWVQSSQSHIYALGDINGCGAFTHTSVNDGEIFWDHYSRQLGINPEPAELDRRLSLRHIIYAMYIDPPLARVGLSESQARQSDREILMATLPMERIARAREKQETKGLVKILVDAQSEQIVGATVFGTGGDEVIGIFAAYMQSQVSYKIMRRTVFPHPTVSELMPWVLDNLQPLAGSSDS
ncbi:mercuric reductase [Vibrio sp. SM6]|uniref:Mercuric reductase n=1 Tax=Vibrio agarilyticus TaxID=2726741 RepID=A0A7X8YH83_9VIBR|nr:mercuric reductase [Vibrio agarilyticus]NLS13087.1 mercuric reductase [Vibrio agarilyticus]